MRQSTALRLIHVDEPTYEDRMEDLRGIVWNSIKDRGLTWTELSRITNLTIGTISRFASGETKRPSSYTVDALADAVGLEVRYIRKGARIQPDEVNGRSLRAMIPKGMSKYDLRRMMRQSAYRRR